MLPLPEVIGGCMRPALIDFDFFQGVGAPIVGEAESFSKLRVLLPGVCPESGCVPISYFPEAVLLYESKVLFGSIPYE